MTQNRFYGDPLRVLPQRLGGVDLVYGEDYDKLYRAAKRAREYLRDFHADNQRDVIEELDKVLDD